MTSTFSVSYQNVVKKVTCKNTASVNQLAELAAEKFKLSSHTSSALTHNGKNLDGLTPLRLTGLVNNAKLVLKQISGPSKVTLKLVGTVDGQSVSQILDFESREILPNVISRFLQGRVDENALESKSVEVSVMRQSVRSSSPEYRQMTVGSLVGSSQSAVLRINIEDQEVSLQKQEQQRKAHEDSAIRSNLIRNSEKLVEKESTESSSERQNTSNAKVTPSQASGTEKRLFEEQENHFHQESSQDDLYGKSESTAEAGLNGQDLPPTTEGINSSVNQHKFTSNARDISTQSLNEVSTSPKTWQLPEEIEDTLYVPQTRTATYENPDEDYELTSNQAEKYYKILKSMQGKPPARKVARKPTRYTIRVRFPDRTLLDLHFDNPETKLGQLLKKLDSYLLGKHVNSYHLRSGSPPFEEIQFGFSTNNLALQDHPHFLQEKVLLIWESSDNTKGPFIKPELQRKDVSELPTVMLETHRGDLEADQVVAKGPKSFGSSGIGSDEKSKPRSKGMPKWFRP